MPKIQGKYSILMGGAVPDEETKKNQILALFRGGCSEGGAVPVDLYCIDYDETFL